MEGVELANELLTKLIGQKAKNVKLGHGSFVTMDFGKILTFKEKIKGQEREYTQGEWHLWICMTAWRIDQSGVPYVGCEDSRDIIGERIKALEGLRLEKVRVTNSAFDAHLEFQNEISLYFFTIYANQDDQWILFTPASKSFSTVVCPILSSLASETGL